MDTISRKPIREDQFVKRRENRASKTRSLYPSPRKKIIFFCVLVRFSPKMQRHETPEALVQEIINDPRARTLLENLISNTVAPKVSATLLQLFSCYVRLNMS